MHRSRQLDTIPMTHERLGSHCVQVIGALVGGNAGLSARPRAFFRTSAARLGRPAQTRPGFGVRLPASFVRQALRLRPPASAPAAH